MLYNFNQLGYKCVGGLFLDFCSLPDSDFTAFPGQLTKAMRSGVYHPHVRARARPGLVLHVTEVQLVSFYSSCKDKQKETNHAFLAQLDMILT